jgi:hypothetical protein
MSLQRRPIGREVYFFCACWGLAAILLCIVGVATWMAPGVFGSAERVFKLQSWGSGIWGVTSWMYVMTLVPVFRWITFLILRMSR